MRTFLSTPCPSHPGPPDEFPACAPSSPHPIAPAGAPAGFLLLASFCCWPQAMLQLGLPLYNSCPITSPFWLRRPPAGFGMSSLTKPHRALWLLERRASTVPDMAHPSGLRASMHTVPGDQDVFLFLTFTQQVPINLKGPVPMSLPLQNLPHLTWPESTGLSSWLSRSSLLSLS